MPDAPDAGPPGYLPQRAARRARKIVLRAPLGVGWILAALAAALVVAAAGLAFLFARAGPPGPPFVPVAELDDLGHGAARVLTSEPAGRLLVVRAGGRLRAFEASGQPVVYCPASRRLESPSGQVWTLEGQLTGGRGQSLRPVASQVFAGVVYVDPTARPPPAPAAPVGEAPACAR